MILEASHLVFDYRSKRALDDVSFAIEKGSVTALVGPNGAGKTTLLRCLTGLDKPISGKITFMGNDLEDDVRHAHTMMGYISDSFGLYPALTVYQHLLFMARAYKIPESAQKQRIEDVIELLQLQEYRDAKASALSRGWRQRLGVALSILHRPDFLLLDEPASGMDPDSRHHLSTVMKTLQAQGTTIIVSSHILAELEDYCTSMLVMKEGRVISHEGSAQKTLPEQTATVEVTLLSRDEIQKATNILTAAGLSSRAETGPVETKLIVTLPDAPTAQSDCLTALVKGGVNVTSFKAGSASLETRYLNITKTAGKS
ncbi:MAG TPA: ABC transporter ATP-binding protein [Patescibacteria group bacterium]|nr:ABC transporter ATP-binding protein [Patescibacteria group bacterium]